MRSSADSPEISGTIPIPDGYLGSAGEFCDGIHLQATQSGAYVGHAEKAARSNECTYTISQLPPDVAFSFRVAPRGVLSCGAGEAVWIEPDEVQMTLKKGEARSIDFHSRCG
jgi:hypothetical protein